MVMKLQRQKEINLLCGSLQPDKASWLLLADSDLLVWVHLTLSGSALLLFDCTTNKNKANVVSSFLVAIW